MIENMKEDLNSNLKEYNFFPVIKNKLIEVKNKNNKKVPLKNAALLFKSNTYQQFRFNYCESTARELLQTLEDQK